MNQSSVKNIPIEQIPLIELHSNNIEQEWNYLRESIKNCTFIALDLVLL